MLEVGTLVDGKYRILSIVGRGGMSTVYMAINEKANKTWAIKEVRKDGVLDFEAVHQGLIVETEILKRLRHPNLPGIVDVIEDDETLLIVMDYIEGISLKESLEEHGALPEDSVIEWARQLCDVLHYLHTRVPPIIYRDMKPANIMLKPDGNICLIDFGTAREYKENHPEDTTCLGTVGYAAPEQFGGMGQTDARTDIYCLGATLYHLVTGRNPSEPPYEIHPIREINPALSGGFEKIVLKCTQSDPNKRYQSCAELMYDLAHYEEMDDSYRRKQRRKLTCFLTAAIFTLVFLAGGIGSGWYASGLAANHYEEYIDQAERATDTAEKIAYYKEAIEIPGKAGKAEAYTGLISVYEEDGVFAPEEQEELTALIVSNRKELQEDMEQYVEVAYETGKIYWYYYGTVDESVSEAGAVDKSVSEMEKVDEEDSTAKKANQVLRAINAAKWFKDVIEYSTEDYENLGLAVGYYAVGNFYQTIANKTLEGEDGGSYEELYESLAELMNQVAGDESEKEIVRLELCELTRYAISQYAARFKADGIEEENLADLLEEVHVCLDSISASSSNLSEMKQQISDAMEAAWEDVQMAYGVDE